MRKLDLQSLLDFYDYLVKGSEKHASALNAVLGEDMAVSLMKDYWTNLGFDFKEFSPCNQGTQKGYRLDCWVLLTDKVSGNRWLYQVEIKNWSAHSIGGKRLSRAISDDEMVEYRRSRWRQQFDIETNIPRWNETKKVLIKMKPPEEYMGTPIRPMLCFWEPMHPCGSDESFLA